MRGSLCRAERLLGCALVVLLFALSAPPSFGAYSITPDIMVRGEYDSNIYLTKDNEKSDFIITTAPGVTFLLAERNIGIELAYHLNLIRFLDETTNDNIGHQGNLSAWYRLSRFIRFGVTDSYTRSNDPRDQYSDTEIRYSQGRSEYSRNTVNPTMEFNFSQKGTLTLGYQNIYYTDSSGQAQDSRENQYRADVAYQFNAQNALTFFADYFDASFSNGGGTNGTNGTNGAVSSNTPNFTGYDAGSQYTYNFTKHTSSFLSAQYTKYNFDQNSQDSQDSQNGQNADYSLVTTLVGANHQFTRDISANFSVGYYWRTVDQGGTNGGLEINAGASKTGRRYKASLAYRRTAQSSYFDRQNVGFETVNQITGTLNYNLTSKAILTFRGDYMWEDLKEQGGTKRDSIDLTADITYPILPWLAASAGYAYLDRTSDLATDEFTDHRIFVILTASYTWPPSMRGLKP